MRKVYNFNSKWAFSKEATEAPKEMPQKWYWVSLPHTWNDIDGQDGGNDLYRGTSFYAKELEKIDLPKADKYYLEFNGANSSATVYVNGKKLASHDGGYSTWRVNITDVLEDKNLFVVEVDNSQNDRVYPQNADFTFYGGLYRDVNIIAVSNSHFDLEYYGGPGIKVTPEVVENNANVEVEVFTTNTLDTQKLNYILKDREGNIIAQKETSASETKVTFEIENVHLWHGKKDPYLYSAEVCLKENDEILDNVSTRFGCRTFKIDPELGFILNGEEYPLRGVSRHQDRWGVGNALLKEHHEEDMDMICELGATTIRLAHYQHDQYFYDLCDKEGMIIWAEIPFISIASETDITGQNAKDQMVELIRQNYNHSSIVMWGVENEIQIGGDLPYVRQIVQDLNDICHREDHTRVTTQANVMMVPDDDEYNSYTDIVAYNKYYGWYNGKTEDFAEWLDEYHAINPDKSLGISEYGCEGIITYHTDEPKVKDYTEEYHALYHETLLKIFNERDFLWGSYVWNFFDFGSAIRDEGGVKGRNNKGLITFDRKIKKDGFYAYKAVWSNDPFVHITSKRFLDRATDSINVKVYSNCDEVTLFVNGEKFNTLTGKHTFVFENVELGENSTDIRVVATKDGKEYTDYAFFNKVAEPNPIYVCPDQGGGFAANWFDESLITQYSDVEITELNITDDVFSSATPIKEILEHDEASTVFKKYFGKMLESPMMGMMIKSSLDDMAKMAEGALDERLVFLLNKELIEIKK